MASSDPPVNFKRPSIERGAGVAPGLTTMRARPDPDLQNQPDRRRNPRNASDPATYGAGIHAQAPGGLHLRQAQLAKGVPELLRRHGHGTVRNLLATSVQGKVPARRAMPVLHRGQFALHCLYDAPGPTDTPERHVHRALQLLEELEDRLRSPTSGLPPHANHVGLVVAARRRLWLAVVALPPGSDLDHHELHRPVAPVRRLWLRAFALVAKIALLLLYGAWRSMWGALRLFFTLRRI